MGAVVTDPDLPLRADAAPAGPPHGGPRVLLVDDEALMRSGLRLLIDGASGIEVVGEAGDGQQALDEAARLHPDVILLDVRMPRMTGLEALAALRERGDEARVVMLTAFDTDDFLLTALRGGAVSFLLKDSPPQEVVDAVLDAAAGRARFSPEVLSRLVRLAAGTAADGSSAEPEVTDSAGPSSAPAAAPVPAGLTAREWEVGRLVAQGLGNPEIGEELFLSVATVKTHLGKLYDKLQVTNRVQLAIRVLELGG